MGRCGERAWADGRAWGNKREVEAAKGTGLNEGHGPAVEYGLIGGKSNNRLNEGNRYCNRNRARELEKGNGGSGTLD